MKKDINKNPIDNEILNKGKDVVKDFDDLEEVSVEPKQMTHKLISIRLPLMMIKGLRNIAEKRGDIGYQQVIKTYIAEGLLRDTRNSNNNTQATTYYGGSYIVSRSSSLNGNFPNQWGESGNDQSQNVERSSIWK